MHQRAGSPRWAAARARRSGHAPLAPSAMPAQARGKFLSVSYALPESPGTIRRRLWNFHFRLVDKSGAFYRALNIPRESTMFKGFRAAIAIAVLLVPAFLLGMHTTQSQNTPKLHRMVIQVSREDTEGRNVALCNPLNAKKLNDIRDETFQV